MLLNTGKNINVISKLNVNDAPKGEITHYWLQLVKDGMGIPIHVPIIVARGNTDGKVLGITAAIHGNELNGIPVIQELFIDLDITKLKGTIVGVPILNVPGFVRKQREFIDGIDLNRIMPGKENGTVSEIYNWRIIDRIIQNFDYLLDLHTASNGRINSYYIRADMEEAVTKKMAILQNAQIILHNQAKDSTLRGTACELGIPSITIEVGNPNLFQKGMVKDGLIGIYNLLAYFNMIDGEIEEYDNNTIICKKSYWIYTDVGGLLTVFPSVASLIKKGDLIATVQNIFGEITKKYYAPADGVVIGKNVNPVNQTGDRILHLGIINENVTK
jgi:predicted deacylase